MTSTTMGSPGDGQIILDYDDEEEEDESAREAFFKMRKIVSSKCASPEESLGCTFFSSSFDPDKVLHCILCAERMVGLEGALAHQARHAQEHKEEEQAVVRKKILS